jgi:hypothetical protein
MSNSPIKGLVFVLGCTTVAFALAACDSSAQSANGPAPPKPGYTVTQRNVDGNVIFTERAVDYSWTDGGCVRYQTAEDQARSDRNWRVICGSPVSVRPEEK